MQALLAVILGAVVATLGGFAATQIGISIERTRRARGAALLCGEILAAIGALLRLAEESVLEGTFLGPFRLASCVRPDEKWTSMTATGNCYLASMMLTSERAFTAS